MEDIPQPTSEPYEVGEQVQVYLGPNDPDVAHHGIDCIVVERYEDDLNQDTGRELDRFYYEVRSVDTDDIISTSFRHTDLVPISD